MRFITFEDIAGLGIDPARCVDWVGEALAHKGQCVLPKKISMKLPELPEVFYNCMPSLVPYLHRGGVKLVTRYPGRKPALDAELLLYDLTTGDCLALMDADWITTMRTGAVAAHSIQLLAVPGYERVGFVGLGNTARATLLCLQAVLSGRPFEVGLLRYKDQAELFEERFSGLPGLSFRVFDDPEKLAHWSEVLVSCATYFDGDLVSAEVFRPGSLLVPVHTRGFASCDLAFDKVFADDEAHVSGFGYYAQFKDKLTEVASVVQGAAPGRQSEGERILAYNIGISLHDMVFASKVYDRCVDAMPAVGHELSLEKPTGKFWV